MQSKRSPDLLTELLTDIHARPQRLVLEFAGAGAQALAWLHGVGGSSRTVLEATDRYAPASLAEAIGYQPARATAPEVAEALARRAFSRAGALADGPLIGVGCTATIATDRTKRGEHRCFVAVCDRLGVQSYRLYLRKGRRSREEEEELVSWLILQAIADGCGLTGLPPLPLLESETVQTTFAPVELLAQFRDEAIPWLAIGPDGRLSSAETWPDCVILSGSFNPLHQGHRQMAQAVGQMVGRAVFFELPLFNADKAPIDLLEARRRAAQFAGTATLIYTRERLFTEKAKLFPNSIFILGIDTAERLLQLRFYHHDPAELEAALTTLQERGCRFYVAGREQAGRFLTLSDLAIPAPHRDLFVEIPPERFRFDISSTQLRQAGR